MSERAVALMRLAGECLPTDWWEWHVRSQKNTIGFWAEGDNSDRSGKQRRMKRNWWYGGS